MAHLEQAIALAAEKHAGQLDKAGQPYILHLLRVMLKMQHPQAQIVAVLHDILEDTDVRVIDLITLGFNTEIINAIEVLTRQPHESRIDAAYRALKNTLAHQVKLADVADNLDISRIAQPTDQDWQRMEIYKKVQNILQKNP